MLQAYSSRIGFASAAVALAIILMPAIAFAAQGDAVMQEPLIAANAMMNSESTPASAVAVPKVSKSENPMIAKAKRSTLSIRYALAKKSSQTIKKSKAFAISKAQGKVTFKKKSGNRKIVVSKKGKITVKKGLKAKTYKVKVKVKASGNAKYKAATRIVTLKIRLRGDIKGNISFTTGEKIYHMPGDAYYKDTIIDEDEGERWFVTERQARKAGWRHSLV